MAIRILVVDEATFIRDTVKKHLREAFPGVEIYDANNGNRAIAQLKSQSVDLILSDWELPGLSGEELLRWVRSSDLYKSLPFILVTSRGDRDHVMKAIAAGVSDYISKPFTPEELVKKTARQLQKAGKPPTSNTHGRGGETQGIAHASVAVLTAGRAPLKTPPAPKRAQATGKAQEVPAKKAAKASPREKMQVQLCFPQANCMCVVRDITPQTMSGLIQRRDHLPAVFDQAFVDIGLEDGKIVQINGYVHGVEAGEHRPDSNIIKISLRFVDNDPDKFDALSRYIERWSR